MLQQIISQFDLKSSLDNYTPFDKEELESLNKFKQFLNTQENVFDRINTFGHITGSGYLFNSDLTQVLLTHHRKVDCWLQFGGHSDGDTNTMRVAVREVQEESGIMDFDLVENDIFDIDVHMFKNIFVDDDTHWHFDIRFAFKTNQTNYTISHESNDIRWFSKSEFESKFDKLVANTPRIVAKWNRLVGSCK
ncbi:MAG: NUDIX hydrolase [Firmicutes bacterium]|nr:NUDIX hydrolase [Bacillota bacterium]MCL1953943.1 NUDIX hydrolase [Bacillota bacterium]